MKPEEEVTALWALVGSQGWPVFTAALGKRVEDRLLELKSENPRVPRDVSAAVVRELEWVLSWPNARLKRLGEMD